MKWRRAVVVGAVLALAVSASASGAAARRSSYPNDRRLRFDQVQLIGTHNSYHQRPEPPYDFDPETLYDHASLRTQLDDLGMRSFEFDVYNAPSVPVFHTLIIDAESSCVTLAACLETIASWSRGHSGHLPIVLLVEPKDLPTSPDPAIQGIIDGEVAAQGLAPWDMAGLDRLDGIVRDALGKSLVTPDEVRGRFPTLQQAISKRGWPKLDRMRGRVVTVLLTTGPVRDVYLAGAPTLEGRAMFVPATPDMPAAAIVKLDVPEPGEIKALVRQHYVVRTQADAFGAEARVNDPTRALNALTSGAQVISTDYPIADPAISAYFVEFPNAATVRCNPTSAPKWCRTRDVEFARGLRSS